MNRSAFLFIHTVLASLAMRFKQPVELLSELEERAPFEFRVRDTRSDRVVLDVGE